MSVTIWNVDTATILRVMPMMRRALMEIGMGVLLDALENVSLCEIVSFP